MAGSLFHALRFEKEFYVANDGNQCYELRPVDGGIEIISLSSWSEMQPYCATLGIPPSAWPVFESAIDVPLDLVLEMNRQLAPSLMQLPAQQTVDNYWLHKVASHVFGGQQIFYARQ